MKIFITGIAGFIGFHLARYLKKRGDLVVGCDTFNSYYDPRLKRARSAILENGGISVLEIDIRNRPAIEEILKKEKITHLVHLAAQAGVRYSIDNPQAYLDANLDGFLQILEACRHQPPIKCIYASSSSVYGNNTKIPFAESDPTDSPASLYAATKKANEVLAYSYHHLYNLSVTGLRFFTVYGPWGRPDMAYYSFTKAILENKPLPVYNNGNMQRDFTYIDDIVKGCSAAIDLGAECEIFNLGNHHPEQLLEMIRLIEKNTGRTALLDFLPMQPGDVQVTYADIEKSKRLLNYHPTVSLAEGIARFIEWKLNEIRF